MICPLNKVTLIFDLCIATYFKSFGFVKGISKISHFKYLAYLNTGWKKIKQNYPG